MTLKQRVESLEKLIPDDDAPGPIVFLVDGVYTLGPDVITEEKYLELCRSCDVFTIEVMRPPESVELDE